MAGAQEGAHRFEVDDELGELRLHMLKTVDSGAVADRGRDAENELLFGSMER
jgi:hypothetical protein